MKSAALASIIQKKYTPYKQSKELVLERDNILEQDFSTTSINQKWVSDITYIHVQEEGWCYLASVMDLHSKKIIGYHFSKQMTTDIIVQALKNAYVSQRPKDKVILHTDLGTQYTSQDFKNLTSELNVVQSFSRKGCPYDNACIESFHATLKKEEVYQTTYVTFEMAYMRNRYVGDDFDRMNRQNKVMEAMIDKVMNQSYTELLGLLDACLPYVETNLTMNEMISFGTKVLTFDLKNIEQTQIPVADNKNKTVSYKGYSPLYVMNNYQDLVRDVHAFIYNDTEYQPSPTVIKNEAAIYETFGTVE